MPEKERAEVAAVSPRPPAVEIEAAPAYELLLSLGVAADEAGEHTYEIQPDWFAELEAAAPELLRAVRDFSPSDRIWAHLLSLAHDAPPPRDPPALIEHLERTDALELRLRLLGYYVRHIRRHTPPDVILRAARGEPEAQREFILASRADDEAWQAALERILPLDPEQTRERLLSLLEAWCARVFPELQSRALPVIERDAERVRDILRLRGGEAAMESALPGIEVLPEPGIDRVILIPSYVLRPLIHSFEHLGLRMYAYPVADVSLTLKGNRPAPRLVRLLKALGDERRLRILRRLTEGSYTLQELSDHFEVGNTTMLHHMVILRAAGLVRLRSGRGKRYSLERAMLPQVGALLEAYLGNEREGGDTPRVPEQERRGESDAR